MVELRGVTSPLAIVIVLQTISMPQLNPDGNAVDNIQQTPDENAVDNIKQKIEQLELELPQLMDTIQMNTDQMDKSNLQVHVMSDQVEPLDAMQISVSTFLKNQISKANVCITNSNNMMMEISNRLIEQRGLLRAIHNDGTNAKAFAEDTSYHKVRFVLINISIV